MDLILVSTPSLRKNLGYLYGFHLKIHNNENLHSRLILYSALFWRSSVAFLYCCSGVDSVFLFSVFEIEFGKLYLRRRSAYICWLYFIFWSVCVPTCRSIVPIRSELRCSVVSRSTLMCACDLDYLLALAGKCSIWSGSPVSWTSVHLRCMR